MKVLILVGGILLIASSSLIPLGAQAQAPITVLNVAAGSGGREERGTFVLNDERSVFNRTDDREVVVLFRWGGTPGAHKLIAQWRSPDGGMTSNSVVDYQAKDPRFGAYWTLPLTPSTPLGSWSIEATVDGLPAGRFTFEVTDRKVPSAVTKRPLSEAELYARLNPAFVILERLAAGGRTLNLAAGVINERSLYTALSAIDGASQVRVHAEGRAVTTVTSLVAWHRSEDWAVATAGGPSADPLPLAAADSTKVGDRCYSMEGSVTSGRVLTACNITGLRRAPESYLVAFSGSEGMTGAP
ncbi:MAG TPA: hypothetical protein VMZ90_06745, partial [Vicinamibacterales bacterium]|nr:hypothetical protein [Vicinamibacterales bacterium]